jgi:hypothetical protein
MFGLVGLAGHPAFAAEESVRATASNLFKLAASVAATNPAKAATIYRALEHDLNIAIRNEARFRHAKLLASQRNFAEAATLYRAILDEQPQAQPARLELAATLVELNDLSAARRLLRQPQAGGLPQDVARAVDQYAAALRSKKPITASFEVAVAPSTNINRATNATTLDTIVAPFQLSDAARAKSGVGLKLGGQALGRLPVTQGLSLVARLSGQGSFYRQGIFNDVIGAGQVGMEAQVGGFRLQPLIGRSWRWYGGELYATTDTASLNVVNPVGRRAQIEVNLSANRADYRQNDLQDGPIYDAGVTYERALSARMGTSFTIQYDRQGARDPGYSTTAIGAQVLVWRDVGGTSLYVTAGVTHLIADDRLSLFKDARRDWQVHAVVGGVFRALTVSHFAPLIRVTYERNESTVGIYDYRRLGAEVGISRAF